MPNHEIMTYSEGIYIVWDAANSFFKSGYHTIPQGLPVRAMLFEPLGEAVYDTLVGKDVVKAKHTRQGKLIYGPDYFQETNYRLGEKEFIRYTRSDSLKITVRPEYNHPPIETDETVVCELKVVYRIPDPNDPGEYLYIAIVDSSITVQQFGSYNTWATMELKYDYSNVPLEHLTQKASRATGERWRKLANHIEFWIIWKNVEYLDLWVNSITIFDQYGSDVMTDPSFQNDIINIAKNQYPKQVFPPSTYAETVVAWFPIDEPSGVDNMAVMQKIDDLMNDATNGKIRLMVDMCTNWNTLFGEYGGSGIEIVYHLDEFFARTNLNTQINKFLYHDPYDPETPKVNYKVDNIELLQVVLERYNLYNEKFILGMQSGKWLQDTDIPPAGIDKIPTPEQLLFNANFGLLYGAKGLSLNNYFDWGNSALVTGLYNPNDNTHYPIYYTLKDIILPRLSGVFGKTLKSIQQTEQHPRFNFNPVQYLNSFQCISLPEGVLPDDNDFDLGFFSKDDQRYFMFLRRWYNTSTNDILIGVDREQFNYNNIKVVELVNETSYTLQQNQKIVFDAEIGDTRLFGLMPVIKYGGDLVYDEIINNTNTLHEAMTIKSGATLTVNGTYNIYGDITVEAGAQLDIKPGAKLNFFNNSRLIINSNFYAVGAPGNKIEFNFNGSSK
jgi:hypothetical protein